MNFSTGHRLMLEAKRIAAARGVEPSVAVVDAAGHLVVVARGKEESWHGPYMSIGKARLAAAFKKPTAVLIDQWKDRPLFPQSLVEVIPGGVTLNKGGYPLFDGDACVGAIGIGGSSPDNDDELARLAAEAFAAGLPPAVES